MVSTFVNELLREVFKDEKYVDAFCVKIPRTALEVIRDLHGLIEERTAELDDMRAQRDAWKAEWLKLHKLQSKLRYWKELALKKSGG